MAKKKITEPAIPATVQELMPAAQALAVIGADIDLRAITERALRRAVELTQLDQSNQPRGDYLPVRDGQALAGAELDDWIRRANDDASLRMVGRGVAYLLKQKDLQAAGVSLAAWIVEQGLKRERVFEDKRVALMYGTLDEGLVRLTALLNPEKQKMLSSLPNAVIERMAVDGTLESMETMTDKQAKIEIAYRKTTEKKFDQYHATVARLEKENRDLKARDGWKGELPPAVQQARAEGSALALEALDCLTRLEAHALALMNGDGLHSDTDRRQTELRAGLGPLAMQLAAIRAQADAALTTLRETVGQYIPDTQPMLTDAETVAAKDRFTLMIEAAGRKPLPAKKGK
jgi:hypothetical protein